MNTLLSASNLPLVIIAGIVVLVGIVLIIAIEIKKAHIRKQRKSLQAIIEPKDGVFVAAKLAEHEKNPNVPLESVETTQILDDYNNIENIIEQGIYDDPTGEIQHEVDEKYEKQEASEPLVDTSKPPTELDDTFDELEQLLSDDFNEKYDNR